MVKHHRALVEPSRMWGVTKPESFAIQVMAELVTQGAEKRAERRNLLPNLGSGPDSDDGRHDRVVPEQLTRPAAFPDSEGAGRKSVDQRSSNPVEISCGR
jgi:hypothetical protein